MRATQPSLVVDLLAWPLQGVLWILSCVPSVPGGRLFLAASLSVAFCQQALAEDPSPPPLRKYEAAKGALKVKPTDPTAVWEFGSACFELRDAGLTKSRLAEIAQEAIDACRNALASASNSAPLHYFLGLNLGALAETRGLSALKLVNQMEAELLRAAELDARFDYAGPDRTLGMLYRDAPSIISVGSRSLARRHLGRAVSLAPHFPQNRLELIRALVSWKERDAARRELQTLEASWNKAKAELAGPEWNSDWEEWTARLQSLKRQLEEPTRLESPRH